jgi:hypothetical protein
MRSRYSVLGANAMVDSSLEVFGRVQERLSRMTAPQKRMLPITEDTEVYRDLKIYGDEIVDLVWWLERERVRSSCEH